MKKRLVTILATSWVLLVPFSLVAQSKAPETALLPEVAAIVLHAERPTEAKLKQDVYAALLGMEAPIGADYMAVGHQIILNNFDNMQKAMQAKNYSLMENSDSISKHFERKLLLSLNLNIGKDKYLFPCADLYAPQCATDTLNKKATIATVIANNSTLMARYSKTTQLPNYGSYYYSISDPTPSYQNVLHTAYLRLAQALIAFEAGDMNQGFALLEAEMTFTKRMLAQDKDMIGQMIAIRKLYTLYHTISVAMDMPQLRAHSNDKRWAALLTPLSKAEQKGIAQALTTERNIGLYHYYTLSEEGMGQSSIGGEKTPATEAGKKAFQQAYDRYETCNITYLVYEPALQHAALSLEEASKLTRQNKLENIHVAMEDTLEAQLKLSKQKGMLHNAMGHVLLEMSSPNIQDYLDRRYDVQIYGALVNAKRLMIQANITADNAEAFLKNGGTQTRNPYTQEVFAWDAQTQTLSTPWLLVHKPIAGEEKNMQVKVPPRV